MILPTPTRKGRYVTISVRPETHQSLVALLRPRESLDALLLRLLAVFSPLKDAHRE